VASIFTKIINGEIPGRIVWSDDVCVAMVDIRPLHPGHCLVIPKQEVDQWTDLDGPTVQHLMRVAHHLGVAQKSVVPCERIGLMIAGFEVPHAHVHVIPISSMAHLDFRNADAGADPDDLDVMADRLREALQEAGHSSG
jgi:diadenosine tetraphosphate (Ap4A) HIT family hydrolase